MRNDQISEIAKDICDAAGVLHNISCIISNNGDRDVISIAKKQTKHIKKLLKRLEKEIYPTNDELNRKME